MMKKMMMGMGNDARNSNKFWYLLRKGMGRCVCRAFSKDPTAMLKMGAQVVAQFVDKSACNSAKDNRCQS